MALKEFTPRNPEKYVGSYPIVSRSSWELYFMQKLDLNPHVVRWASETIAIPYISPLDGKKHRYYPDFVVEYKNGSGEITKKIIEIKPLKECLPGTAKKARSKAYQDITYLKNQAKWEATKAHCDYNGFEFQVLTERELFGK